MPAILVKQSWNLPSAIDRDTLVSGLLRALMDAVDELARAQRAFDNARQALAIAHKHGAPTQGYLDEVGRCEVGLSVAVTMTVYQRGLYLEGLSQEVEPTPFVVGA